MIHTDMLALRVLIEVWERLAEMRKAVPQVVITREGRLHSKDLALCWKTSLLL
jgi:hypothetical protein